MADNGDRSESSRTISRRRAIQTGGAAAVLGLSGCLGDDDDDAADDAGDDADDSGATTPDEGVEITILSSETAPASQDFHDRDTEAFEEETGHTLNWEYVSFGEKVERLASMTRAGNPPELFDGNVSTVGSMLVEDRLRPLTHLRDEIEDAVGGEMADQMVLEDGGETYMLPFAHKTQPQTVRGDLLEDLGYEVENFGVDWDTHREWVQAIDEETDANGIALAIGRTGKAHQDTINFLWSGRVDVFSGPTEDIEVTIDQGDNLDRAVDVLEYMADLWEYSTGTSDMGWGDAGEAFSTGSVGSVNYSVGRMISLPHEAGQPWAIDGPEFIQTPFHDAPSDDNPLQVTAPTGYGVMDEAENADAAEEYLLHLYAGEGGRRLADYCQTVPFHNTPTMEPVSEFDVYQENEIISQRPDIVEQQDQVLEYSTSIALSGDDFAFNPIAPPAYGEGTLGAMAANYIMGTMSAEEAVQEAADEMRGFLD